MIIAIAAVQAAFCWLLAWGAYVIGGLVANALDNSWSPVATFVGWLFAVILGIYGIIVLGIGLYAQSNKWFD